MTFTDAVNAHAGFLERIGGNPDEAESAILKFLDWDEPRGDEFARQTRIVLVSADFSKEITISVLWLNERELDIRCVRLRPYMLGEKILLDIQQVLPLPEAADYQVQLRKKAAEERQAQERQIDWSRYDLKVKDELFSKLYKRQLFLQTVRALVENGIPVTDLRAILPARKFIAVPGKLSAEEFRKKVAEMKTPTGVNYDFRRFYMDDDDLFFSGGMTWALSNQWSIKLLPKLDELIGTYPQAQISYTKVSHEANE